MFRILTEPLPRNGLMVGRPEILGLRPTRTSFKEIAPNSGAIQRSHFVELYSEIIPVFCSSRIFKGPSKCFLLVNPLFAVYRSCRVPC